MRPEPPACRHVTAGKGLAEGLQLRHHPTDFGILATAAEVMQHDVKGTFRRRESRRGGRCQAGVWPVWPPHMW